LLRPYWRGIATSLLLGSAVGCVGLVAPYLSKLLFDEIYPARDVSLMHLVVLGVAVTAVASSLMGAVRSYFSQVIGTRIDGAVGLLFFNHLQHLHLSFFERRRVGEIGSRFGDLRTATSAVTSTLETLVVNGVYLLLVPPLLLGLNWRLALVSLVTVPITASISSVASRSLRRYWQVSAEATAELSAFQFEALSNMRLLKPLGSEHDTYRVAGEHVETVIGARLRGARFATMVSLLTGIVRTIGTALFTLYAWSLILDGALSLGAFVAFSAYVGYLTGPVNQMAGLFSGFQRTAVSLGRMFEYLEEPVEVDPSLAYHAPAPITRRLEGGARLDRVSLAYSPGVPALLDVTLELKPGTVTAVVGATGAGKSSLLRLLCRLSEPTTGRVTFDGHDAAHFSLSEFRRQVAVVGQEVGLIRGSLWDNLTLGARGASRETVEEALRICRLETFVVGLADGLETAVGEWGATLSGGQKQRISLARALARDPRILLLDEVTSQLDPETEAELLREMLTLTRSKTLVLVTHRLSIAQLADQVCVLEAGRVAEVGTHRELVDASGVYRRVMRATAVGEEPRHLRVAGAE
jgi:ABC-type bacteriocin/lantibiotic exporter with double-glycine peptidase domain